MYVTQFEFAERNEGEEKETNLQLCNKTIFIVLCICNTSSRKSEQK